MKHEQEIEQLNSQARAYSSKLNDTLNELKRVIVGQELVLSKLLICLIADGHVLLEGVPGLAKTLMVKTLSDTVSAQFCRIQFTPDLLPADITGTKIYDHRTASFSTQKGPIFNNFILADEINRAPPKVQSALLEAMQERQVSIQGETFMLDRPFLVLATQNPIETEGTYKLPEAQVDRFSFKLLVDYPTKDEEKAIIQRNTQGIVLAPGKVLTAGDIIEMQQFNQKIYADEKIEGYVTELVDATRYPENYTLGRDINDLIEYGASPRASIWAILSGKAHALLNGRGYVIPEDIKAVVHDVLRHRIILTYEADAEGITSDHIIDMLVANIKAP
ncbi:ATPase [ANME-1 cluster archaeon AG-394-G21]|nr:ATPase [ANME-1 cluster archaeon AG-394-G21]NAT10457.1 ATPase [ANME-1 cluster archaeon AG-394-G06]